MKRTAFNWTRLLRTMIALLVIMSLLLCGCAGVDGGDDDDEGGKKNEGTSADGGLLEGDGDGKLEAEDVVDNATGIYGTLLDLIGGDKNSLTNGGYSVSMDITVGDSILEQLSQMMEAEGLDADVSWFKSMGFVMDVLYNEHLSQINMEAKLNGTGILSMEAVGDLQNGAVFLSVPELNSGYFGGTVDMDMDLEDFKNQYNEILAMMEEYGDVVNALPTEQELNTLIDRYVAAAQVALGEPVTATETLTTGGMSQEVTATTYTIHTSDVINVVEAMLTTAKTDAELEQMLDEFSTWYNEMLKQQYGDDYVGEEIDLHAELMEAVEEGLEAMAEARAELVNGNTEDMEMLTFSNYLVDEKSVGFALSVNGGYESTSIYMYNLEQDGKTAFELNMADTMTFAGTGTLENGKASGSYTLSSYGEEMLYIDVVDFDTKALKKSELKGTLRLRVSEELLYNSYNSFLTAESVIELVFDMGGGKTNLAVNLYNVDGLLFGVALTTKALSGKVQLPNSYADINDSSAMQNWAAGLSFDKVLRNLRSAGVSSELVDMLEEALNQSMGM